ncbi:cupin domain-containing protein [Luteipulveratus flavus]|uniref:Cupin domain-containing protein n=1 Tax=Luteipulveratus flavus TaxID=3031728 RepID=A0ABT6CCL9_9MICO|nr:cupin domain-containing protein [Luteipulveratus sp. YIM 133296]MDF8266530.1 cupin domain-containing protein [Luteipulveratus sp. YIM 133296]
MDDFGSTSSDESSEVPEALRTLFNQPDGVRVQVLPCQLPGLRSMAVHFGAGTRTVPHTHHGGQHLVYVDGVGVVGDDAGVHVVRAGDVVSSPPGAWHWHGAVPGEAAVHVTFEQPGDFDRDVDRRDWDTAYTDDLGA